MLQYISASRPTETAAPNQAHRNRRTVANTIVFVLGIVSVGGGYKSNSKLVTVCGIFVTLWSFTSFLLTQGHTKERDPENPHEEQTQAPSLTHYPSQQLRAIPASDPFIPVWDPVDLAASEPTPESVLLTRDGTGLKAARAKARRMLRVSNLGSPSDPEDLPDWMEDVIVEPFWEGDADGEDGGA
ncbi:hypothetical protein BDP27DRAFT_1457220 [Rhodocollybia butyracea]|uniref:Transmembrane protein n=1 Tax=Rhodocollybia butyracea TaxID=206335 RepID=A0A9P5P175_9AGAR|nr:hypothetical protein BDP27DRAFT_1457220 [Rhodocollybia butyracea]